MSTVTVKPSDLHVAARPVPDMPSHPRRESVLRRILARHQSGRHAYAVTPPRCPLCHPELCPEEESVTARRWLRDGTI